MTKQDVLDKAIYVGMLLYGENDNHADVDLERLKSEIELCRKGKEEKELLLLVAEIALRWGQSWNQRINARKG